MNYLQAPLETAKRYIQDSVTDLAREIWDVRYPVIIVSGAALFLLTTSALADYSHRSRVSSNIKAIKKYADVSGDGRLNSTEKMGILLKAFPRADRDIQDQLKVSMRSLAEAGRREGVHPFDVYSEILDREFDALLDGYKSELFPVTTREREALLEIVVAICSKEEQERQ